MKKRIVILWIALTLSLFAIVRDTNALPLGTFPLPSLSDADGYVLATPISTDYHPNAVGGATTYQYDEATTWAQASKIVCNRLENGTTPGFLYFVGQFGDPNASYGARFFLVDYNDNYYSVTTEYVGHDFYDPGNAGKQVPGLPVLEANFLIPKTHNTGGDLPNVGLLCTNTLFVYNYTTGETGINAIYYYYYGFTNGTYYSVIRDIEPNLYLGNMYARGAFMTSYFGFSRNAPPSSTLGVSNVSDFYHWVDRENVMTTPIGVHDVTDFRHGRDFLASTGATEYTLYTLPMHLNLTMGSGTLDVGTPIPPNDTSGYYANCTSLLDVGCFIAGFGNFILGTISDFLDFLFPDISFQGNFNSCGSFSGSGQSLPIGQRFGNIIAIINPFPPDDNSNICTLYGEKTIIYQAVIPDTNIFQEYIPGVAPQLENVNLKFAFGQTPIDLIIIFGCMMVIFYQRSKHD